MLNNKDEQLARKVLAYLVRCDMVKLSLSNMGTYRNIDKTKISHVVYNKVAENARRQEEN